MRKPRYIDDWRWRAECFEENGFREVEVFVSFIPSSPKELRRLAAWLLNAADWIDAGKEG